MTTKHSGDIDVFFKELSENVTICLSFHNILQFLEKKVKSMEEELANKNKEIEEVSRKEKQAQVNLESIHLQLENKDKELEHLNEVNDAKVLTLLDDFRARKQQNQST